MFDPSKFQSVSQILYHSGGVLKALAEKITAQQALNTHIKQLLPAEFDGQTIIADLTNGTLILTVPSHEFAMLLNFQKLDLLSCLRTQTRWCGIATIKIQVAPQIKQRGALKKPEMASPCASSLPAEGKDVLRQLLENMHDDKIKHALEQLIKP